MLLLLSFVEEIFFNVTPWWRHFPGTRNQEINKYALYSRLWYINGKVLLQMYKYRVQYTNYIGLSYFWAILGFLYQFQATKGGWWRHFLKKPCVWLGLVKIFLRVPFNSPGSTISIDILYAYLHTFVSYAKKQPCGWWRHLVRKALHVTR